MAEDTKRDPKKEVEVWECQTKATVWVYQSDPRDPSGYRQIRIGGPNGTKRARISRDDREFTQEQVLDENAHLDPFRNGQLKRVDGASNEGILTDEDLEELLTLGEEAFAETVEEMDSELSVRRLRDLVEAKGTVPQYHVINDLIERKYKVGYPQKTVREMELAQADAGGEFVER